MKINVQIVCALCGQPVRIERHSHPRIGPYLVAVFPCTCAPALKHEYDTGYADGAISPVPAKQKENQ